MDANEFLTEINAAYHQLEMKQTEIVHALFHRIFEIKSGWYNGHYHKSNDGEWCRESYPIPVVSVNSFCDIEIQFEAYGVEDYLADYYHQGQTIQELKDAISCCNEDEIGFSFTFPFEIDGKQIFEFIKLLRREGFYY